jgi:peroxiredoxin
MPRVRAGDFAPDFTLETHLGETVQLAEAVKHGPVVLIFYPMDDTPG